MAKLATSATWKVDDRKPDLVMYVQTANSSAAVDLTGTTATKFFLYDLGDGTYKLEDDTTGVTNAQDSTGVLTKEWQDSDLGTAGRYAAWFSYERGAGKVETTTAVEVNVVNPYESMES
jgi:hypothetical protein